MLVLLLLGLALLLGGLWMALISARQRFGWVQTEGKVVANIQAETGRRVYYPLVEFQYSQSEKCRFKAQVGSLPAKYRLGAKVKVLYNRDNPEKACIKSFEQLWLFPALLVFFGVVITAIGRAYLK